MGDTPLARVEEWLRYARELQLDPFYVARSTTRANAKVQMPDGACSGAPEAPASVDATAVMAAGLVTSAAATPAKQAMPNATVNQPSAQKPSTPYVPATSKKSSLPPIILPATPALSLFESSNAPVNDSLDKIREDIGDCVRCKLHTGRTNLVFGAGNAKAELVFIGEGPGRDEDIQGLPFVGRSGKLLTSMIEAMGLKREQVYICNVVKCRPPDNRTPEKDEVGTCSPFLFRQIKVIAPKAIVCLGAVAAQAILATNQSVSRYRGEWLDFMGSKLMITYHPAYLLRNPSAKGEVWKDLQKVMVALGLPKRMAAPR